MSVDTLKIFDTTYARDFDCVDSNLSQLIIILTVNGTYLLALIKFDHARADNSRFQMMQCRW